ncbi:MAG TPA: hypothetical protein VJ870_15120 [Amycolatopsis sp.]|nr:hypothetical protein [Amycolatopsis sp.]
MLDKAITFPLRVTIQVMFSLKNLWEHASEEDASLWPGDEYETD